MQDHLESSQTEQVGPPLGADLQAQSRRDARRRFFKVGAAAVPVGLTLVSRPVRACQCVSTSAWGSAMIAANVSAQARLEQELRTIEGAYSLSDFCSPGGSGWNAVCSRFGYTKKTRISDCKAGLTLGTLCGSSSGPWPSGCTNGSHTKVWDAVSGNCGTYAQVCVAAYLNCLLVPDVALCVNNEIGGNYPTSCVHQMWSGSYQCSNGKTWQQADCQEYMQRCCIG